MSLSKTGKESHATRSENTQPDQSFDEIEQKGRSSDPFEPASAFDRIDRTFFGKLDRGDQVMWIGGIGHGLSLAKHAQSCFGVHGGRR